MMKNALVSLVVVFILIMTLAGGCVPTAMAENAYLPSQPAPRAATLHDPAVVYVLFFNMGMEDGGTVPGAVDNLFEMVAHPEIAIAASNINGTMQHSPQMVRSVVTAAERAGVPFKVQSAYLGIATDAAPFSRAGLKATTLLPFRVPQQMVAFYHQKCDSPDVLAIEPLLNVLKPAFEWVRGGGE